MDLVITIENLPEAEKRNVRKDEIRREEETRRGIKMGREAGTRREIERKAKIGKEIVMGKRKGTETGIGTGTEISITEIDTEIVVREGKGARIEMMMMITTEVGTMIGKSVCFFKHLCIVFDWELASHHQQHQSLGG